MKNRLQRQFEGFINTPLLWKGNNIGGLVQCENIPIKFPEQLTGEEEISSSKNLVLGKRVESFFAIGIKNSNKLELLAANIQIYKNKITLGEIDFLLKDKVLQHCYHIELVYKFYVYDPSFSREQARWIGPNRKDSLLEKVNKLKTKQLPLLHLTETSKVLANLNLDAKNIEQQVCFKASIFIPKHLDKQEFPNINKECIAGYWISMSQFEEKYYERFQFFAPPKQDWPIAPKFGETWFSYSEIKTQIMELFKRKKSPLIWMKKPGNVYERFFIVWW